MIAEEAYVLSKSFTKKSLDGQGALKGAPCTIKSITEVDGGQKITFEWTGTSGTKQTSEMTVKNGVSVTGISDKGNGKFTLLLSDGSESDPIQTVKGQKGDKGDKLTFNDLTEAEKESLKGSNGVSPTITENANNTDKIYKLDITTADSTFTTPNLKGADGQGGGTVDVPINSISVNGVNVVPDENKNVDITVPSIEGLTKDADLATVAKSGNYEDLSNKPAIPSVEGLAKTTDIPTKVSQLENDSNYLSSIPEEYVTETELSAKGYLTEHQDLSNYATKDEIPTVPSKVSELTNDSNYQTADDVTVALAPYAKSADVSTEIITEIAKVVADAPEDLNTLKEMSDWIAGHENDASAMNSAIQKNKTDISTLQTDKADASDLTAHTDDADIHVTADDKTLWNTVEDKVDKTSIVTALDDTVTDEQVASALLAKTELDKKIDKTSIVTELSDSSTDDKVVGALTAYNELQKLESANKEQFATASGDYITATDSVDGKLVELGIKGNSFQQTYSGKNLLVYPYTDTTKVDSGVTFTDNGDGSVTINGTNTTDNWLYFWLFGSTTSEESKRENLYGKQLVVSGLKNAVGSIKLESYYKTTDGKEYWVKPTGNDNDYFTITYPSKSEVALMNLAIVIYPNGVVNNVTVKPMIRLATEIDSSYEPYVGGIPSPNPEYPQTINSVGDDGSLVVKSCGKNLAKNANLSTSLTSREVTFVTKSDGTIVVNGTPTQATDNWVWCTGNSNFLLRKGKYLWTGCPTNDGSNKYRLLLRNVEKPWKENNDYGNGVTFELTEDKAFCFFVGISYGYVANNLTFKPMLRRCDDNWIPYGDDLYEPYHETTTTIPLSEPLRSIGDIKDEITYQNGKWGILRRIKEINLSDLAWSLVNNDTYQYWRYSVDDGKEASSYNTIANIIAEKYMASSWYNTVQLNSATNAIAYGFNDNNTSSKLVAVHNGSTTESPTGKFLYELITPTFEPFADQTLPYLSTYNGVTNISNDDTLSAEMTVKYPTTDASGVGSRNESRIAELAKDTDDKFDDVNDSLSVIGKCKNLLNPTLDTTTKNGVTCTKNDDGTYTLNGTASANTFININTKISVETGKTYNLIGFNGDINIGDERGIQYVVRDAYDADIQFTRVGGVFVPNVSNILIYVFVWKGITLNNVLFKPMLTTDLNATYDDFVPYTGDGDTLTHDVAAIKNDLSPKKIELQNVDERVTIQDNGSFIINGFAFVNLLVTFNETLQQWSNFVRLPRPKGGNVTVYCENSVRLTIYSQDNLPGDCGTYDIVQSGTEIRLLVNYEVA